MIKKPQVDPLRTRLEINDPIPQMEEVDAMALFNDLVEIIRKHVLIDDHYATAVALWIIGSWCAAYFERMPLLVITAPERASGKSLLLRVIGKLVPRPLPSANMSLAALFRVIEKYEPTVLLDEVDVLFDRETDLVGLLNDGYERGGMVLRVEREGDEFHTVGYKVYGPKVLAGIALGNRLPDATLSRAIVISMRRKLGDEQVQRLRKTDPDDFAQLRSRISKFVTDNKTRLEAGFYDLPEALDDREQDNWEPLFAIASCADEQGLARALSAASAIHESHEKPQSIANRLLQDVRDVLAGYDKPYIATRDLLGTLTSSDDMPWRSFNRGHEFTPRQLAKYLGSYGVKPRTVRLGEGDTPKGYAIHEFDEVFQRYLAPLDGNTPPTEAESFKPAPFIISKGEQHHD